MKPLEFGPWEIRISSARANNSKFALVQQLDGRIHLYTVEGRLVRVLPNSLRSDTQVVFSRTSVDHVFYIPTDKPEIWRHNLIDDYAEKVAEFPEYERLSAAHAEGDLTPDGWLALCGVWGGWEHAFCYNLHTQAKTHIRKWAVPFDGLKAAYDGWLLVSGDHGIRAFHDIKGNWTVAPANGHSCTAVYQGRPKLLWFSNARPDPWRNAVELIDIENPSDKRVLMDFGRDNYAGHVSASRDAAYISIYDPTTVLPSQVWKAPFDGTPPTKLTEWYGPYNADATPRASYSDDRVLYNRWDGTECRVFGLKLDDEFIDYSSYAGRHEFAIIPQLPCPSCGSTIRGILDRRL